MRRTIIRSALLLVLCAPALLAQKKEKEVKPGDVELKRLEDQWAAALPRRDRGYFEKYLAPKFIYTEDDKMIRRDQMLRDLTSGPDSVTAARNDGMEVHQFGATTAVVTGWLIVEGKSAGTSFTHRYRFTDTWVKRKAGWQIVAAQDYLVPK